MDKQDQADQPEQASMEPDSMKTTTSNDTESISQRQMDDSKTTETREMSGVRFTFGAGMEVTGATPPIRNSHLTSKSLTTEIWVEAIFQNEKAARRAFQVLYETQGSCRDNQSLAFWVGREVRFEGLREDIERLLGALNVRPTIYGLIKAIKLTLSLDGKLSSISVKGKNGEAFFEAVKWLNKHTLCDQIHEQPVPPDTTSPGPVCVICGCPPEEPLVTRCKHFYCGDCLGNLCSSTFSIGSSKSKAICQASNSDGPSTTVGTLCGHTFGLRELLALLGHKQFERLLVASFRAYVHRHPEELQNCPTADCDQLYFVSKPDDNVENAKEIVCPECLIDICTRCQEGHAGRGLTCAEFQQQLAEEQSWIAPLKVKEGIKNCPKCTTMIQKTNGCSHMECSVCSVHWCWQCLEMFEGPSATEDTYRHLKDVHGEPYDFDDEELYEGIDYEQQEAGLMALLHAGHDLIIDVFGAIERRRNQNQNRMVPNQEAPPPFGGIRLGRVPPPPHERLLLRQENGGIRLPNGRLPYPPPHLDPEEEEEPPLTFAEKLVFIHGFP
ncbi:hypothetical protein B0T20DRAFT_44714 [Sordaria brevicollis]|uniref:RING-type domain-containing protein n=1 Tax=Sordaria brevicollis TaxID=83679 RepID=A0AAE0P9B8_SORBR|nr:hypothetical protein B0T20DRAFT_44714 [Sordaria brevicollis]